MIDRLLIEKEAYKLRERLSVAKHCAIELETVLEKLGVGLIYHDLGVNIFGAYRVKGMKRIVVVSPELINKAAMCRFTIGHEIGHLIMHNGSFVCDNVIFTPFEKTHFQQETEANIFSSELLLPKKIVSDCLRKDDLNFNFISNLAAQYKVSISVATIKAIQLYSDVAIGVLHDGNKIKWQVRSEEAISLKIVDTIPSFFLGSACEESSPHRCGEIDADVWSENLSERLICEEETQYFRYRKEYLTLLKFYSQ